MNFDRRLTRLERQNRFLKATVAGILLLIVVITALGAGSDAGPDEIAATAISIVDDDGNLRLRITADETEGLDLVTAYSAKQRVLWTLGQRGDAGLITVRAAKATARMPERSPRVEISVEKGDPLVTFKADPYSLDYIDAGLATTDIPDEQAGLRWQTNINEDKWSTAATWTVEDIQRKADARRR